MKEWLSEKNSFEVQVEEATSGMAYSGTEYFENSPHNLQFRFLFTLG